MPSLESRFLGAFFGCAIGDALGAPIEGMTPAAIADRDGLIDRFRSFRDYPAGQYTDDTQLALAIARAINRTGGVDGQSIAEEFAELFQSGEIVGAGPVARRAVERFINGVPWDEAAVVDDLPFNGAAMRIAPIGLWNLDDPDGLVRDAEISSIVTHRHPTAIDAALVIGTAVANAATTDEIESSPFLDAVAAPIEKRNPALFDAIVGLKTGYEGPPSARGVHVDATQTTLAVLHTFVSEPDDFLAMLERCFRLGGDVDTVAAMAGSIFGALRGIDALPAGFVRDINDSNMIRAEALALYHRKQEKQLP